MRMGGCIHGEQPVTVDWDMARTIFVEIAVVAVVVVVVVVN